MPFCNQNGNFLKNGFSQKIAKNAIFAKNRFFSNWFIWLQRMIYGWKCVPGTFKSHLKPISGIYDVIGAFSRKSIFFDFWTPKIFFRDFCWCRNSKFRRFPIKFFSKCLLLYHISSRKKMLTITQRSFEIFRKNVKKSQKMHFNTKSSFF